MKQRVLKAIIGWELCAAPTCGHVSNICHIKHFVKDGGQWRHVQSIDRQLQQWLSWKGLFFNVIAAATAIAVGKVTEFAHGFQTSFTLHENKTAKELKQTQNVHSLKPFWGMSILKVWHLFCHELPWNAHSRSCYRTSQVGSVVCVPAFHLSGSRFDISVRYPDRSLACGLGLSVPAWLHGFSL